MSDSRVLQRYGLMPKPGEPEADDEALDLGAFGWLRGMRERAVMLELRKKTGHILAVGYSWLERMEFDPSEGITLVLGRDRLRLLGHRLNSEVRPGVRLFEGLTRHRVPWVQEADQPTQVAAGSEAAVIEQIQW